MYRPTSKILTSRQGKNNGRLTALFVLITFGCAAIIARLFVLMVMENSFYVALANGAHDVYAKLVPVRGSVYIQDTRTKEEYPLAINKDYYIVFADAREIKDDMVASSTANHLAEIFNWDNDKKAKLFEKMNNRRSAYVPIENKVDESVVNALQALALPGIYYTRKSYRFYPEGTMASNVVGFLGKDDKGLDIGRYGIEGYWHDILAGKGGFFEGSKSAAGSWLSLDRENFQSSQNGADLVLTIDRALEFMLCKRLKETQENFKAASSALILMDPATGAIRAMCSFPEFDPNNYNKVESVEAFNNTAIFTPYEPGSIFKPLTMAAAIQDGVITPDTIFTDTGSRDDLCQKPIKNALEKSYGRQTMVGVLENSINTGVVFAVERLGKQKFRQYVENFGLGAKEGIELGTEVSGNISSLSKGRDSKIDCYSATAAFGQGLTVTPLQMVTAFGAIANGGLLLKPYIVDEIRYSDGVIKKTKSIEIRRVVEPRTASLVRAMMVSVVEYGQAKKARVPGYYIGGKTGTAQIAGPGGYSEDTNHSFVGILPGNNPKFVMLLKLEKPNMRWADSTVAPLFSELARDVLQYYGIPPNR